LKTLDNTKLEELLARTALSDRRAFQQLYELSSSKLNGVAYRIMNNVDFASEVLQEAFIQIWKNAGEYRAGTSEPMAWMASIVRYRAFDRLKFEKRRIEGAQIQSDLENFDTVSDGKDQFQSCEIEQQLQDCLELLDETQQKSILMAYYYGYSREEISEHYDSPVNTVKSWLRRGLVRLQECLGK
jgi:RNA polymerase sigma-70 factor (ECF subfamily)